MTAWKRWLLVGGGATLVILALGGYHGVGRTGGQENAFEDGNTYTPDLTKEPVEFDETDYTPPFRPLDSEVGQTHEHADDEDGSLHILPVDTGSHSDEDLPASSNPHDPLSDEAKDAHDAEGDFTEELQGKPVPVEATHTGPTSFETDSNPSSTTFCSEPHNPEKPLVQYALTIDAGSTGSRIHVYKFHNCHAMPSLEYETFKMINPGLSSFARDPTAAAASLDSLLDEAKRVVPEDMWNCSPVEVKATAGLRLLGAKESEAILDEVRNRLETNYPFVVGNERSVEIMDGKDEGVYAWITANYLQKKIGEGVEAADTLAVMDLGGASTQIVFEPIFPADSEQSLAEGEHKYLLNFGGKEFTLYQHSYLGYGLMRARRSVHNLVAFTWSFGRGEVEWDKLSESVQVPNPCLVKGSTRRVELDPPGRNAVNVSMHGVTGGYEACKRVVELVMAKDAICEVKPCSFDGVYQPSLLDTFPRGQLLALSYFTDRIKPLLPPAPSSGHQSLKVGDLTQLAKDVCAGLEAWETRFSGNQVALDELNDRPEYCLDLTFMNALLGLGYELKEDRELLVAKQMEGVELGWALGAGLALVEKAKLTCTA